jgi:site-specific DNA recombinase
MEKLYLAYTRVSTARQGERGVSLQEQQDAIQRYAQRFGLAIKEWFEERESAAKRGRPVFTRMLKLLRQEKAQGIIIHKIDRSARNLKDWSDLGEMIDSGIEVHFANESLDLHTRGGRLSADIQAVVAADYIRNLREESKKGFYGRLKQGLFPIPAPIGYLDCGKGKPKEPNPAMAPLVAKAFELYGTGRYSLHCLVAELHRLGLRNRRGSNVSLNGLSTILNNPFYIGLMRINTTGELFPGQHQPLVNKALFERVQRILQGKTVDRVTRHDFTFRRLMRCATCGYSLIGERQKGHVYYRCHTAACPTTMIREESVEEVLTASFSELELDPSELDYLREWICQTRLQQGNIREKELARLRLRLDAIRARLNRLTDALIDGVLEKPLFDDRKNAVLLEEREVKDQILEWERNGGQGLASLEKFLELVKSASNLYKTANPAEKRDLIRELTSNLKVSGKNVVVERKLWAQLVAERPKSTNGRPFRGDPRTWAKILNKLYRYFSRAPQSEIDALLPRPKPESDDPKPNPFVKELTYEPIKPEDDGPEGPFVSY